MKRGCWLLSVSLALFACSDDAVVDSGCDGHCATAQSFLADEEVGQVIAAAVAEARLRQSPATIAVVDRVGNVLGVYRMANADETVTISSTPPGEPIQGGLEGVDVIPAEMAAISKAITAAYLSSEGNAFSTRTASQIVQEHFNPGEVNQPGGPLFGVQFSQLPCSDFMLRQQATAETIGPKRSPLGLSADPGGFPLYKSGVPVGGVGVIADGIYGLDKNITGPRDEDVDELIALAASRAFIAPQNRRAEQITVDGKVLRFSDAELSQLLSEDGATFTSLGPNDGALLAVRSYNEAVLRDGEAFGQANSGVRADETLFPGQDAFVLVDQAGQPRYPPIASSDGELSADEVQTILAEALAIANRARGQIRRPLGSPARVSITLVDTQGAVLGQVRGRDAPVFGLDVSLQKARTAAFYSSAGADQQLRDLPDAQYLDDSLPPVEIGDYVDQVRAFLGDPRALRDGAVAFADRSGGNLSRPFFPNGLLDRPHGPFSKPQGEWSPFAVGLQLDLIYNALIQHVVFVAGGIPDDVGSQCTGVSGVSDGFVSGQPVVGLANGIQIFPGSVPVYRGRKLLGGLGVSGDGIDQDDMISFLGVHNAGLKLGTVNNAPADMRADNIVVDGIRLRYINCPQNPFLDTDDQDVCAGL